MFEEQKIPGCFLIRPNVLKDERGRFVKTFQHSSFEDYGLRCDFVEEYYSVSHQGVIRGMHFQTPPCDHAKTVYCVSGSVIDAVVDLRKGSPMYGKFCLLELTAEKTEMLYIPSGVAHGFCAISEDVTMLYKVTSPYSPECDKGIRWDSAGITWPVGNKIISDRDKNLPTFANFKSPFVYKECIHE